MAKYLQRSCLKGTLFENRGPGTEGQAARAGDHGGVREMWLSACVGVGSREVAYSPIRLAPFDLSSLNDVYSAGRAQRRRDRTPPRELSTTGAVKRGPSMSQSITREAAMKSIRLVVFLLALYALTLPVSAATLVVLNKSEHTASLIDPDTGKTLAKLPVGRGPHEVIVSPDGRTAYVSNFGPYGICPPGDTMCKTPGNTITVLDLAERK